MAVSRRRLIVAFLVALLATSIGSTLLPLGLSHSLHGSVVAGIALNLWAVLLAPSICFTSLVFSPEFIQSKFRFTMALGFLFNVITWTLVLYGGSRLVARLRSRHNRVPIDPPNPRLQRTRMRAPLSRKPLDGTKGREI